MLRDLWRGGIVLMRKSGKDACGCRIVVFGEALSTAAIRGSDTRLVFLLHSQFAVCIP